EGAGPGEIALEQQAVREALLTAQLQGVVLRGSIVAEVFDGLRPAELLEEQSALVGIERAEADDGRLVDVVIGAARRDVCSLVAHVGRGKHYARELLFER